MVAPNYAARRSTLAKELGLGRKRAPAEATAASDEAGAAHAVNKPVFASDIADDGKMGRHTAESVFANFGRNEQPDAGQEREQQAAGEDPSVKAPRKRGRKAS